MYHLVYLSSARATLTKHQLRGILEKSRSRNAQLGITGLLLHQEGKILQVLEGEERAVRGLYETIQADPRHAGCTTLLEHTIPTRQYPDWPMAFRDLGVTAPNISYQDSSSALLADFSEAQRLLLHLHFNDVRPAPPRLLAA